jgi:hypothetical protein
MRNSNLVKISIVLILLFISVNSFAQNIYQEGYIINSTQDTVRGFIKMKGSIQDPNFKFKTSSQSNPEVLSAADVKSIVINDYRYFKPILLNSEEKFAQALVDGKASLFLRDKTFYLLKDEKLNVLEIEKIEVESKTKVNPIHKKKTYIGVLKSSMSDCPSVWETIDRTRLEESGLTNLVDNYNECINESSLVFKKSIPSFKLTISALVTWNFAKINTEIDDRFRGAVGYWEEADLSDFSISPGIAFTISNPRLNNRIAFSTEIRYASNTFQDRVIYPTATYDDNDITIKSSYIYFPLTVKYDIPMNLSSAFYIKGGLLNTFLISSSFVNVRRVSSSPNSPPIVNNDTFDFYSSQTGFTGSLGYQMKINKKLDGWIEMRFDNTGPIINSSAVGFLQNVISLVTAISF